MNKKERENVLEPTCYSGCPFIEFKVCYCTINLDIWRLLVVRHLGSIKPIREEIKFSLFYLK